MIHRLPSVLLDRLHHVSITLPGFFDPAWLTHKHHLGISEAFLTNRQCKRSAHVQLEYHTYLAFEVNAMDLNGLEINGPDFKCSLSMPPCFYQIPA